MERRRGEPPTLSPRKGSASHLYSIRSPDSGHLKWCVNKFVQNCFYTNNLILADWGRPLTLSGPNMHKGRHIHRPWIPKSPEIWTARCPFLAGSHRLQKIYDYPLLDIYSESHLMMPILFSVSFLSLEMELHSWSWILCKLLKCVLQLLLKVKIDLAFNRIARGKPKLLVVPNCYKWYCQFYWKFHCKCM